MACPLLRSRDGLAPRRGVRLEPDIGQQFVESFLGMGRQTPENILKVGEGIDVVVLAGAGQGVQDGRRPTATVAPQEGPVVAFMPSSA